MMYTFDNCEESTGDGNCNFVEAPIDNLDWVIATGQIMDYVCVSVFVSVCECESECVCVDVVSVFACVCVLVCVCV